jgi:hypothetical protein
VPSQCGIRDSEIARLSRYGGKWATSGLQEELREFLGKKKSLASDEAGRKLYRKLSAQRDYLKELSRQTEFINAELLLNGPCPAGIFAGVHGRQADQFHWWIPDPESFPGTRILAVPG